MSEFSFKIRTIKEKDYSEEQKAYMKKIEKAAEPVKKALEDLAIELGVK